MTGLLARLHEKEANTDPRSDDPRLSGRTYTIRFEDVWQASMRVCGGGLLGWSIGRADDQRGIIEALAKVPLIGSETDVHVQVGLDQQGQTRVDAVAVSRGEKGDWGRTRRLIGKFSRALDAELGARPEQILDPTRHPVYRDST